MWLLKIHNNKTQFKKIEIKRSNIKRTNMKISNIEIIGVFRFDRNNIYLRNNKLIGTSLFYDFIFNKDIFFKLN